MRALLEEEEEQEDPLDSTDQEMASLLRELRRKKRGNAGHGGLMSAEQLQGFMWGVGAAALMIMVLPAAKQTLRPFAVAAVKRGMDLFDQFKGTFGEAGEGLQDLFAEAQFERMKEAVDPGQTK